MTRISAKKIGTLLLVILILWLGIRYLLPVALPFLLGAALAFAAEPMVRFLSTRLRLPRGAAAGIGVTGAILLFLGLLVLLVSVLVKELASLTSILPDMGQAIRQGLTLLQDFLLSMADRAPDGIRDGLTRLVLEFFGGGTALIDTMAQRLPGLLTGLLGGLPDSFLSIGTGLIAGFMISARLPKLRIWVREHTPALWREKYLPALKVLRKTVTGWLRAQLKLSGITVCILAAGFLILQIPYAPLWALVIALVDAIPILGTGTVLLPWALVCLLQGNTFQAIGLGGIYAVAALTRSVLEPRFLGSHLGLDPLVTLIALYAGYRLWGFLGMILAPLLAVAAMQLSAGFRTSGQDPGAPSK